MSVLTFGRPRVLPLILQAEAAECGLACVAMVAGYFGHTTDLTSLRQRYGMSSRGATLRTVMHVAERLGLSARALRLELPQLKQLKRPAILHWSFDHFVVLRRVSARKIIIHDPAVGRRTYSLDEAAKRFTGAALELTPRSDFAEARVQNTPSIWDFWKNARGLGVSLSQIVVLSLIIQIFALATPFYMQVVVDDVLVGHDRALLPILALGFAALTLASVATKAVRGFSNLYLVNQLNYNMGSSLFHHLIRLPIGYFEKRHIGDVVSRFGSLQPIQDFMTGGAVSVVIDGMLSMTTLALMVVYSPLLAGVVVVSVLVYAGFRLAQFRSLRSANQEDILAQAKMDSIFMESVRGLQGIKLAGREMERQGVWQNRFADSMNTNARLGRLSISYEAANNLLTGLEHVLVIYLGAHNVLGGVMTIGMLYAFMSYRSNFSNSAISLVDQWVKYRMIAVHLERLADMTQTEQEPGLQETSQMVLPVKGALGMRNVHFAYSQMDPPVVSGFDLDVDPGEFVVLFGPSGAGKTTLLKILMGLLAPSRGQALVDGMPLEVVGLSSYRRHIAAVMQEDVLFSGTLRENIALFDLEANGEAILDAAKAAGIHDEIARMPMAYDSLIGDMGASLSMGQQQRVLLARALYRAPRILFLDEGTGHLDAGSEGRVMEALRQRNLTCIYITHNPALLEYADVIVDWSVGGQAPHVRRLANGRSSQERSRTDDAAEQAVSETDE